jgi:hypothetical protein
MMTRYDDERVVTLLRDIDLPTPPVDRLGAVSRRARAAEGRRLSLLAGAMALVLVAGIAGAVALRGRPELQQLSVADAAKATQATGSARLTMQMSVKGAAKELQIPSGGLLSLTGLADFQHGRYVLRGTNGGMVVELRVIGADHWMKVPAAAGFGNVGGKPWIHSTEKQPRNSDGIFGSLDPAVVLDALKAHGTVLSTSQVGDRTRTVLRLSAKSFGSLAADVEPVATVDTDSDGRVRTIRTELTMPPMGTVALTMSYDDFGIDVKVTRPPADQVQEAPTVTGGGIQTQHFSTTTGASPADRKKACAAIKTATARQPKPTTDEQKRAYARFQQLTKQICGS